MGARDDLYRFFPRTIHRGTHTRCDVLGQRPRWSRVTPTLLSAFFYFDMSFMVWVILGPLGVQIAAQLHLDAAQKGLMVALPVLAGALLRPVNGLLVDRLGPKRTGAVGQMIVIAGLLVAWALGIDSFAQVLALGLVLGVAGSS